MIKNPKMLEEFENQFISGEGRIPYAQSLEIFTALWEEGVALGAIPPADPLEGIEVDIRMARILNSCLTKSSPG